MSRPAAELAVTYSAWINAWSLRRACAALGVDLRVQADRRELPLPALEAGSVPRWAFMTDEASLGRALEAPGTLQFWPRYFPRELLDDKWAFAEVLREDPAGPQGLAQWPLQQAGEARYPVVFKCRHSWRDGRKLPRGWVCRDASEVQARRAQLPGLGLREDWFFLQQWLADAPLQLLSVGGFFDAEDESRNLALVTERAADYGDDGPSSSAMLVTVDDAHGLAAQAARALRRLRFRGPYEFEFIVQDGRAHALELNPRFWMQHGLFGACGNGLVQRYLGRDTLADRQPLPPQRLLWVDGVWLLRRLLRADLAAWRALREWTGRRGFRAVVCPPLRFALWAGLWRLFGGGR